MEGRMGIMWRLGENEMFSIFDSVFCEWMKENEGADIGQVTIAWEVREKKNQWEKWVSKKKKKGMIA